MRASANLAVLVVGLLASVHWTDASAAKAPKGSPVAATPHRVATNARAPARVPAGAPVRPHAPNIAFSSAGGKSFPAVSGRGGLRSTPPQLRGAAVLGGPAKYDPKKAAVTGGAVMGHKH
jgi:hypothetical protein